MTRPHPVHERAKRHDLEALRAGIRDKVLDQRQTRTLAAPRIVPRCPFVAVQRRRHRDWEDAFA